MKFLFFIIFYLPFLLFSQSFNYLPALTNNNQVIHHTYYSLSYSEQYEQAEWVAYELTKDRVSGSVNRVDNFREDVKVLTGSATLDDYKGSGYDRGHLAPAGDMKFSRIAMSESFFMSNMSPQNASFNRGIWRELESLIRKWAVDHGSIYVITGGVLNSCSSSIGDSRVGVPNYYYKVILYYNNSEIKAIAFLLPNQKGTQQLSYYVKSINYIEDITGIDFFPELSDDIENRLEEKSYIDQWSWMSNENPNKDYDRCQGIMVDGSRCYNTVSTSAYCYTHAIQSDPNYNPSSNRLSTANRCVANMKSGKRCKRKTYCVNKKCSSHEGNCY